MPKRLKPFGDVNFEYMGNIIVSDTLTKAMAAMLKYLSKAAEDKVLENLHF